jgi:hypothetical protein
MDFLSTMMAIEGTRWAKKPKDETSYLTKKKEGQTDVDTEPLRIHGERKGR